MEEFEKEEIMEGVKKHLEYVEQKYPQLKVLGIFVIGSQNYGLSLQTDEYRSNLDTVVIVQADDSFPSYMNTEMDTDNKNRIQIHAQDYLSLIHISYFGQIPQELRDHVAKIIPVIKVVDENGEEIEKDVALKDAIKGNEELENLHKKYPAWFDSVIHLSGLPKSRGCHASAIMITPKPVTEYCSICNNKDGEVMYEDEMHSLMDDIKLIKMDCLGLKNLSVVDVYKRQVVYYPIS